VVAAIAGILASGIAAMLLELIAYRPLRILGAPRHAGMISGLGASIVLQEGFALAFGRNVVPFPEVLPTATILQVGDGLITNKMLLVFVATIGVLIALDFFVSNTRLGRGIRAVAQEPRAASLMGVNITRVVLVTFLVGGLAAGLAGFLYSLSFSKTIYSLGFLPGIKALAAAILGGVGSMRGAVLGGFTLGLMENFGTVCLPVELKDVIAFGALVVVLLFRPQGILGRSR
jgi:branched-chain amino acid transport system permease protein